MKQYSAMFLISTKLITECQVKDTLTACGIKARYNTGLIPKILPELYAPLGGQIYPKPAQDDIFDPISRNELNDFDISKYWSDKDMRSIQSRGVAQCIMAAAFVTLDQLKELGESLKSTEYTYVWHWHQWTSISNLSAIKWH